MNDKRKIKLLKIKEHELNLKEQELIKNKELLPKLKLIQKEQK